jgi:hypothetical protein
MLGSAMTLDADRIETSPMSCSENLYFAARSFIIELILREFREGVTELDPFDAYPHLSGGD